MDLTLDNLKFPNVYQFSRDFGTKKTSTENAGSLTTEEFAINSALPFDIQRPVVLTESVTLENIEYDAKALINAASVTVTLGSATAGIVLTIATLYTATITDGSVNYTLNAGDTAKFIYFNSQWSKLNPGEYFGTVADGSTQTVNVTMSNYTGTALPIGSRVLITFSDDYSYDGQPSFTINGGTTSYLITVQGVAAGLGAFISGKNYEFIVTATGAIDCVSSDVEYYSTSEIKTNKYWINGKPIYSRTFTGTTSNTREVVYNGDFISANNIDLLVNMSVTSTSSYLLANDFYDSSVDKLRVFINTNGMFLIGGSSYPERPYTYIITLLYTKTTD